MPPMDADAPIDMMVLPAACKALPPGSTSGTYMIDPDGAGADAPLSVYCDMDSDSGGWTVIFFPTSTNLTAPPTTYTSSTARLLADAQSALIAYRNQTMSASSNYASFALPSEWKTATPFSAGARDVPVTVKIDGGAEVAATLRYGYQTFTNVCTDPWGAGGFYGRICVTNTHAPYFNGWNANDNDSCSDSSAAYNAQSCSSDLRFSIAVR